MREIIKKAIEGEWNPWPENNLISFELKDVYPIEFGNGTALFESGFIEKGEVNGRAFSIHLEEIVTDHRFWQSLGKACGWIKYLSIEFKDKNLSDDGEDFLGGKMTYPYYEGGSLRIEIETWKYHSLRFHEINLTEGWDKAIKWLSELVENN